MPKFIASDKLSTDRCKVKQDGHGLTLKSSLKSQQALKSSYIQPAVGSHAWFLDLEWHWVRWNGNSHMVT